MTLDCEAMTELKIEETRINVDGDWWELSRKMIAAVRVADRVFVIFDYLDFRRGRPAPNLWAYNLQQTELWKAENPTSSPIDAYSKFESGDPLVVTNLAGYVCTIEPETGEIITTERS